MSGARHLLDADDIGILRQILQLQIDHAALDDLVVGSHARLSTDQVVAGEHGLLSRLSLAAWNRVALSRVVDWVLLSTS